MDNINTYPAPKIMSRQLVFFSEQITQPEKLKYKIKGGCKHKGYFFYYP